MRAQDLGLPLAEVPHVRGGQAGRRRYRMKGGYGVTATLINCINKMWEQKSSTHLEHLSILRK